MKLFTLTLASLSLIAFDTAAQSQVISVQFNSQYLKTDGYTEAYSGPGSSAGLTAGLGTTPVAYWNGDTNDGPNYVGTSTSSLSNLVNSNGVVTGVSESTINDGFYNPTNNAGFANAGDNNLTSNGYLASYQGQSNFTLNLTGLSKNTDYSLIIYTSAPNGGFDDVTATDGTSTYYFKSIVPNYGSYTQATSTTLGTYTPANYVEFNFDTGTGTTFSASLTGSTGNGLDVNGFQLAVPEPSTWAMMLGGMGVLIFCVRRKAAALK